MCAVLASRFTPMRRKNTPPLLPITQKSLSTLSERHRSSSCTVVLNRLLFSPPHSPAVRRHDDEPDPLHLVPRDEEWVLVLGVRGADVRDDLPNLLRVRASMPHSLLRLAHLARRDHLHRAGDLLRVLHALDLGADFLGAGHVSLARVGLVGLVGRRVVYQAWFALKSSTASLNWLSTPSFHFGSALT